jgi:hypothetical protein
MCLHDLYPWNLVSNLGRNLDYHLHALVHHDDRCELLNGRDSLWGFASSLHPVCDGGCQGMRINDLVTFYQLMATYQEQDDQVRMQIVKFLQSNYLDFYSIPWFQQV